MELAFTVCHFCKKNTFKYTCPKCNALYCGHSCFRKPGHKKCTSSFYNIFNKSSTLSQEDRSDVIMRYLALKHSMEIYYKTPEKAESESESVESESIWTNDDYVSSRMVDDRDSDDDRYPYFDYAYDSNDDGDSSDEGDELNDEDDDSSNDDRDVSDDNDNNNGDDANGGGDLCNHVAENSIADGNHNGAGNATENGEESNVNDNNNEYDLSWEVD